MKKIICIMSLILVVAFNSHAQNQDPYYDNHGSDDVYYNDNSGYNENDYDNGGMSYQTFYDQLSPYGSWVYYPGYGYVWVPQVDQGFSPYNTAGHWEYTEIGWTWVSDYEWGWAAFHYGSWTFDAAYGGWLWIPGYDWAPAWVTWGEYGGYYCWAPLGPRDYINGHWGDRDHDHYWNCLPREHMGDRVINNYIVNSNVVNHDRNDFESHVTVINHNNTYSRSVFNAGPHVEQVESAIGHPVTHRAISTAAQPSQTRVQGNSISIYRPAISHSAPQQHAVPGHVVNPAEAPHNNVNPARGNNSEPRNIQPNVSPERANPVERNNPAPERSQPSWTPPRQSVPRQDYQPRQNYSAPSRPSGGFIPSERPSMPSYHASPSPSFGGGNRGGGGRHR